MISSALCFPPVLSGNNPFLAAVTREVLEDFKVPHGGTLLSGSPGDRNHTHQDPGSVCAEWMAKHLDIR